MSSKPQPYSYIQPVRLTTNIGAEINCGKLTEINSDIAAELYQAMVEYKVIFIRDQTLSEVQLCEFSKNFGSLMQLPYIKPLENFNHIIAVLKEADEINMGVFGGDWHSDFSFFEEPPMASVLYSLEIPDVGGDTVWVNMAAAYRALPESTKCFLKGRTVIHTGTPYGVANAPDQDIQFKGSIDIERNNPEADRETPHPAVCRHPDSAEEMLFISPTYSTRFGDMSQKESEPILKELYSHCARPEFSCRFRWAANSVAIWDNRSTMHYAVNDYDGHRRLMYRTTIKGVRPVA
jgi:taurine dioxygenase